jgi:hypothetical protein
MAIKLNLTTSQFGVPFEGAYFRIVTAAISNQQNNFDYKHTVMIDIVGYATLPNNDNIKEVDFRRYNVPYSEVEAQDGLTFISRCYKWIMNQPDMIGSVSI